MEDVRIVLSGLWVSLMLTYLLGDVMRIYAGDFVAGEIGGMKISQGMLMGMAAIMVVPAIMVFLTLVLGYPLIRWVTIILAIFFFGFNLIGLPGYHSAFDKFLIVVGLGLNVLAAWYAWNWT